MQDTTSETDAVAGWRGRHPRDVAEEIRGLPAGRMSELLLAMDREFAPQVLRELPEEVQARVIEAMPAADAAAIIRKMFSDDVADVLSLVSSRRLREILAALPAAEARAIGDLLKFAPDTAGGIMQTEVVSLRETLSIAEAVEVLRKAEDELPAGIFYIYVTDAENRLRGVLRVRDLLFGKPERLIAEIMLPEVRSLSVHADQEEIARLFRAYGFGAMPVVDDFQRLRGVVTVDDVLQVVEDEATEDMQRMIGLSGEETASTPWLRSIRNRLPWLYVNLATAFLAGWVVSLFEGTIAKYAVLAVFLPIIAGQGGNSGTQTLTIIVRAIALGEIPDSEHRRIFLKETLVGLLNGLAIGVVVGAVTLAWKGEIILGVITFAAMVLNMVAAAMAGVIIPLGLKALRIDPALASAIMLTTVTDVVGFFIFLSLAAAAIAWFPAAL